MWVTRSGSQVPGALISTKSLSDLPVAASGRGSNDFFSSKPVRSLHPSSPVKDRCATYVASDRRMLFVTQSVLSSPLHPPWPALSPTQVGQCSSTTPYEYVTPHSQPPNFHLSPLPAVHRDQSCSASRSPYMILFLSPSRGLPKVMEYRPCC